MVASMNELCPQAPFSGQGHAWRTVCATGGGLLRQCRMCKVVEWTDGRETFDAAKAEVELLLSRKIEP